jgi:hypothetical protein
MWLVQPKSSTKLEGTDEGDTEEKTVGLWTFGMRGIKDKNAEGNCYNFTKEVSTVK